jgi:hypothetical protein
MPSLSLQQTRTYIDRLGDLENELTRTCRVAEVMAKDAGKDVASSAGRLKEACKGAREQIDHVADAKRRLLEFDGFLRAQSHIIRESLERPHMVSYLNEVGGRMGRAMESHVEAIASEAIEALRRVAGAVKDMRDTKAVQDSDVSAKASVKSLEKICDAAEKAIREGIRERKHPAPRPEHEEPEVDMDEEIEVEVEKTAHGYNLTAGLPPEFLENAQKKKDEAKAKKDDEGDDEGKKAHGYSLTAGLPPEFLENAQKKKDEAKAKKDDEGDDEKKSSKKSSEHGYSLTAESKVPGNESKGPKDEGEEDEGWVPGHRTKGKGKEAAHGYDLRA